jgi:hypothetical protein
MEVVLVVTVTRVVLGWSGTWWVWFLLGVVPGECGTYLVGVVPGWESWKFERETETFGVLKQTLRLW